ncbi:flagellar hook capping FlgD N-terminal domain-containing protein [Brevibacillus formosus]|uniref:flagellar hook assembly protein FlgD n=1 Tax=Brevibacillus TaxID=55080 RepID=UPI000D0E6006|nr:MULTISPECIES: flagellar hook capping FlgD N-terminal domain-containing protein [Brevibacillus]MBG9940454.1 flagellar hook capping protein [Brevibacillus formosus]MED1944645.1 flagellar hook capping FlgD N-terminal domain-containing protein [Brevibacillus formosus]MED1996668.1 flagellar hook capping FlgD N-terminal domain-containing protein [Brevibacillus formosus]MED2081637.1 flagellar hook capping FlgD N-terminal domain-containing protein [Brevibacillus formosus]PSK12419.1 flagellar hook c
MSDTGTTVKNNPYIQPHMSYKGKKEFSTELDQNAFMKLMLEQLKHQDPMSPMDNSQFIQQTSMLTMVEKITKMTTLMEQSNNSMVTLEKYEKLVGRTASYSLTTKDEMTGETKTEKKEGVLDAVYMDQGKIYFRIAGESTPIPLADVSGLESQGLAGNTLDNSVKYMEMIGREISYKVTKEVDRDGNPDTTNDVSKVDEILNGVITGFTTKNGTAQFQLDNGSTVKAEEIVGMTVKPENRTMGNSLAYAQMIGYNITYNQSTTNPDGTTSNTPLTGVVKAVSMKNGVVEFVLQDDKKVALNQITGFEATA